METDTQPSRVSSYLVHLPAIFHQDPFVGQFLLTFEKILSGLYPPAEDDPLPDQPGLEDYLDRIHTYFDPGPGQPDADRMPEQFLPWMAGWVALSLREDWDAEAKRRFIARIVQLYRLRGTRRGLEQVLETYTQEEVTIYEFAQPVHYFQVEMTLSEHDPRTLRRKDKIARAIIDQEKPAHTFYVLKILIPTMQIRNDYNWDGENRIGLRMGMNTMLGTSDFSTSG